MRSQRGGWLDGRGIGAAAFVLAVAVASAAHAQPGFGPDPFWPYNNQYTPYVAPIGPASPMAGGNEMWTRQGNRGANQFQEYLSGITGGGPGRLATDRAGIGMPGYRSAVDPSYKGGEFRAYQPNVRLNPSPRENRRQVADTYFAYFSERNPRKRAALLKELRQERREPERTGVLGGGASSPSRILDAAMGGSRGTSPMRRANPTAEESPSRSGRSATPARAGGGSSRPMPPPPDIPSVSPSRTTGGGRSRSTPSRVLDRAGGMNDREDGSTPPASRSRRTPRSSSTPRSSPTPPNEEG